MSIASYPWNSTAEIRAHYAQQRRELHARYERKSVELNREEERDLAMHRQLMAILAPIDARQGQDPQGLDREATKAGSAPEKSR